MTNVNIRGAVKARDNGLEVSLEVTKPAGPVRLGMTTIQSHRDHERRRAAGRSVVPPTDAAGHVLNLDGKKCRAIEAHPDQQAKLLDAGMLGQLAAGAPDVVRMLFGRFSKGWRWSRLRDEKFARMAGLSSAELVYVPSLGPDETAASIRSRVQLVQAAMDKLGNGQKAFPTVHIHHKAMKAVVQDLAEAAFPSIAVEMKGMQKVAGNLSDIHDVLRAVALPPYVVAFNVTREQNQTSYAASALILARFGVQASCQKVGGRPPEAPTLKPRLAQRWFHPNTASYLLPGKFPAPLKAVCKCEVCRSVPKDPVTDVKHELLYEESSNHEVDSRRLEIRRMAADITGQGLLAPYIAQHQDLVLALNTLS